MRTWKQRLRKSATEWLALPPDALLEVSRLTCVDGGRVVIENVVNLIRVEETIVEMDLGKFDLILTGHGFSVSLVARGEVHVEGEVHQISYSRHGGERR